MKKFLAFLLCAPAAIFADAEKTVLIAGSDFQAPSARESAEIVSEILGQIRKSGVRNVSHVLFCGDYTVKLRNRPSDSEEGIAALAQTLSAARLGIESDEILLAQGNHDPIGTRGIASSGTNDPAHARYGIFVINEDDFMWMQSRTPTDGNPDVSDDEAAVKHTAKNLDAYLKEKYESKFCAPIFIVSHLPLHYSMRTYNDGDGRFAKYIFDTLNRAGKRGQKIIFLYGHNHSNGWDNYLGGARVFLSPEQKIPVAVPSDRKRCTHEPLAFTYLNAGYTGYFSTTDKNDGADRTLSMTVFEIDERGNVNISRFSRDGDCALAAPGVPNTRNDHQETHLNLYVPVLTPELPVAPRNRNVGVNGEQ